MAISFFLKMLNPNSIITLYRYGKIIVTATAAEILDSEYEDSVIRDWDFSTNPLRIFLR